MVPFITVFDAGPVSLLPHFSIPSTTGRSNSLEKTSTSTSTSTSSTRSRRSRFLDLHRRSSNVSTSDNSSSPSHEDGSVQRPVGRSMRVKIRDIFRSSRTTEKDLENIRKVESRDSAAGRRRTENSGRKRNGGGSGWMSLSGYDTEDETEEQERLMAYESMRREEAQMEEAHWSVVWASVI